tara:strand:+ start:686 stop:976 length:291 start_codon:yes stop_codon:yes gene_type:complete
MMSHNLRHSIYDKTHRDRVWDYLREKRERAVFTTHGVRPMIKISILKNWRVICKILGKNQTQLADELVEKDIPKHKITTDSVAVLIENFVKKFFPR